MVQKKLLLLCRCKLMLSNSVNLDPKSGTVENELLEGFSKEIDLSEKNTFNISALKQVTKGMLATVSLFYVSFEFLVKLDSFFRRLKVRKNYVFGRIFVFLL